MARQILICPMLDDRNTVPDPALVPFASWSYDDNYTGFVCGVLEALGLVREDGEGDWNPTTLMAELVVEKVLFE